MELVTCSSSATEGHVVSFCAVVSTNGISLSFWGSAGIVFNLLCYTLLYFHLHLIEVTVDYGNIQMAYTVPSCQNSTCVNVTIVDDDIVEKDEITGSVSDSSRIRMTGGTKVITITDNDSMLLL